MDLDRISIFIEVVRRGSLASVARDRNVDPSSISRAIASLEKTLGLRLLQRTTRKLAPTEAGLAYLLRVEPLLEELANARESVSDDSHQVKGVIRVLSPVSFGLLNLVPLIPSLAAQHPHLEFDLVLTDAPVDLIAERIDLALRLGPMRDSNFIAQKLAPLFGKICASPGYIAKHGRPLTPADLANHNCLALDYPGFASQWTLTSRKKKKVSIQVAGNLRSSNAIALKQCALAGMGVILQATWIIGAELREGSLVDLFPAYQATAAVYPDAAIWAMYPSRSYLPQKVRIVLNALKMSYTSAHKDGEWDLNGS